MVVPIVASICRELFLAVPHELEDGALALGATRWEMVRGVVLSSSRPGHRAPRVILGLGRALGEAIAVTQVIGSATAIHVSLFAPGDTLASRIAAQFQGAGTKLQTSSLFYLAAILLVIGLVTNLTRAADRAPLRRPAGGRLMASMDQSIDLGGGGRSRRRRWVNRLAEVVATARRHRAVAVLASSCSRSRSAGWRAQLELPDGAAAAVRHAWWRASPR